MTIGYVGASSGSTGPPLDPLKSRTNTEGLMSPHLTKKQKRLGMNLSFVARGESSASARRHGVNFSFSEATKESSSVKVPAKNFLEKSVEGEKNRRAHEAGAFLKSKMVAISRYVLKRLEKLKKVGKPGKEKKKKKDKNEVGKNEPVGRKEEMGQEQGEGKEEREGKSDSEAFLEGNEGRASLRGTDQGSSIHEETEEVIANEAIALTAIKVGGPTSKEEVSADSKTEISPPKTVWGIKRTEIEIHSFSEADESFKNQLADEIGLQSLKLIRQKSVGSLEKWQAYEGIISELNLYYLESGWSPEEFNTLRESIKNDSEVNEEVIRLLGKSRLNYLEKSLTDRPVLEEIKQSKISGKTHVIVLSKTQDELIIKPSGKIYLKLKVLGEGGFKVTSQMVRIAANTLKELTTVLGKPIFKAYSPLTDKEEIAIHQHLISYLDNAYEVYKAQFNEMSEPGVKMKSKAELREDLLGQVGVGTSVSVGDEIGVFAPQCHAEVDSLLQNKNLSFDQRLKLALLMAKGVSQLHAAGVIHRDLNTTNFLYTYKLDEKGNKEIENVKVIDFGVGTIIEGGKGTYPKVGIAAFYPPGWVVNKEEKLDPMSDAYQLGIVLYQLAFEIRDLDLHDMFPGFDNLIDLVEKKLKPAEWDHTKEWEPDPESEPKKAAFKDLMLKLLDPSSDERLTSKEAVDVLQNLVDQSD